MDMRNVYIAHLCNWGGLFGWVLDTSSLVSSRTLAASGDLRMFGNGCLKTHRQALQLHTRLASRRRALRILDVQGLISSTNQPVVTSFPVAPFLHPSLRS